MSNYWAMIDRILQEILHDPTEREIIRDLEGTGWELELEELKRGVEMGICDGCDLEIPEKLIKHKLCPNCAKKAGELVKEIEK